MATIVLRDYLHQINQLLEDGRFNEATRHCHHILQQYPRHIDTYRALAKAYLEQHQYTEAIDLFHRVLSADPNDFISHVGLAIIHKEETRVPQAIWHMERAFELQPYNAAIRAELQDLYGASSGQAPEQIPLPPAAAARLHVNSEMYALAAADLQQLRSQNGERIDLEVLLAETLWRNDQRMEAVDVCLAVLDKLPHCVQANAILADIWLRTGRLEEAKTYLQRLEALLQPTREAYGLETAVAQAFLRPGAPELPEAIPVEKYDPEMAAGVEAAGEVDADLAPAAAGDYAWLQDLDLGGGETAVAEEVEDDFAVSDSSLTARLAEADTESEGVEEEPGDTDWFKDEPTAVPDAPAWLEAEEEEEAVEGEEAAPEAAEAAGLFADADTGSGMEDLPEWLRDSQPDEMEPLQPSEDEMSDWLDEMAVQQSGAGDTDWFREETGPIAVEEDKPETDWFQDTAAETEAPAGTAGAAGEEPEADDLSWLAEAEDEFEPVYLDASEVDEWGAEEAASEEMVEADEMSEPPESEPVESVAAGEEEAPSADEFAEEEAEKTEEPAEPMAAADFDTGELPDWLADGLGSDFGRDLDEDETDRPSTGEIPDWIMTGQLDDKPDQLSTAEDLPAWLAEAKAAEEPSAEEQMPEMAQADASESETLEMEAPESEDDLAEESDELELDQLFHAADLVTGSLAETPDDMDDDLPDWLRLSDTGLSDEVLEPDEPDEADQAIDDLFGDLTPLAEMGAAEDEVETLDEPDEPVEEETAVGEESGELTFDLESIDLDQLAADADMSTDELFAQFAEGEEELPDWLVASESDLEEIDLETGDLSTGDLEVIAEADLSAWLDGDDEHEETMAVSHAEDTEWEASEESPEKIDADVPVPGKTAAQLDALADMMAGETLDEDVPEEADTGLLDWLMSDVDESGEMEAVMMGESDERADEQRELPDETPPEQPEVSGAEGAEKAGDEESPGWLDDLAAAADVDDTTEEEVSPEMAGLTTGPLPDWLQELSESDSGLTTEEDAGEAGGLTDFLTDAESGEVEEAPTDMLDWLQEEETGEAEAESEDVTEEPLAEIADDWASSMDPDADLADEPPAWLSELAAEEAGSEEEAEPDVTPTPPVEEGAEEAAEADDLFAALEEETAEPEESLSWLDELDEDEGGTAAGEEPPEAMGWLDELDEVDEADVSAAPPAEAEDFEAALAGLEAPEAEPELAEAETEAADVAPEETEADEVEEALAWLDEIDEESEMATLDATEADDDVDVDEAMAWLDALDEEEAVSEEAGEADEALDWLTDMAAETEAEEAPEPEMDAVAEEEPAETEPESDEIVFPDEAMFPSDVGAPSDVPEELDDTMAWMEQFAAEQGVSLDDSAELMEEGPEEGETAVSEPEGERPEEADMPQATTVDDAYTAEGAEDLVFPDEAMFPRDVGEPTDAPEELDDAMAWLEELAAEQGTPIEELPTVADRALPETVVADETAGVPAPDDEPVDDQVEVGREAPEEAAETPPSGEPQATTADDAYTAEGAEDLVFPDEAMFPRDVGEPTDAPQEIDDAMNWLEELAGEQGISMEVEEEEEEAAAPPPAVAAPETASDSLAHLLDALAQQARQDTPDLEALLADTEPAPTPDPAVTDLAAALDWVEKEMVDRPVKPSAPAEPAEPDVDELPEDPEAAMAWLEQFAESDEKEVEALEPPAMEGPPAAETSFAPPETVPEEWEMPEDPDEAMAWLEQLADEEEEIEAAVEVEEETPPVAPESDEGEGGIPEAASAADAYTAAGAEELVFPDEAMFPRDLGEPTDAPQELEDTMSWLEALAEEQGVSLEEEGEAPPAPEAEALPEVEAPEEPSPPMEDREEMTAEAETAVSETPLPPAEESAETFADLFEEVEETEDTLSWMDELAGDEAFDTDFLLEDEEGDVAAPPEEDIPPGSLSDMVDVMRQRSSPITDDDTPSGIFDDSFDAFLGGPEINLEEELAESWPEWLSSDPEEQPGLGETGWLRSLSEPDVSGWLAAEDEGMASDAPFDDSYSESYLESAPSDYQSESSSIFDVGDLPAADPGMSLEAEEPSLTVSAMELDREKLEAARDLLEEGSVEGAVDRYQDLVKAGQGLSILIADLEQATQRVPQEAAVRRLLGDAYMRNGQLQKALDTYRQALDMI